ncbi:N-6 DNA methylase [Chryseobacterium sp. CCH4-E10]|uniref:N-6 DNA methylase n=1 Tax=Chryseobacterium sp. CCH4-E10 TaxID=1768758 RepID=UPI0008331515|nr:N-6 DNA methylase [Chryseobacterium sp. CCH4-E10]
MKDYNSNNEEINDFTERIWKIFDILKNTVPAEDYHVILFLLSLYKDGRLRSGLNHSTYISQSVADSIRFDDKYSDLAEVYSPIIKYLSNDRLYEILRYFENIDLFELQQNFASIFDSILYKLVQNQSRTFGEFIHPKEIIRFIMNLAELPENATVYNPFAGLASFATFLDSDQRYFGQELNRKTWALGKLRLMAYELKNAVYEIDDSISDWNNFSEFDLIVTNPPFGMKLSNYLYKFENSSLESFIIGNSLSQLRLHAKLICLFSVSFLFSENRKNKKLRKALVDNNFIDTIVLLPTSILQHSSIQLCIIVFKKSNNNEIRFVDASQYVYDTESKRNKTFDDIKLYEDIKKQEKNKFIKHIDLQEIKGQDYNLAVTRYFISNDIDGVRFKEIGHFILGSRGVKDLVGKYVKIRDLKNDIVNNRLDFNSVETREIPVKGFKKIEQDCLLVALRWKTLKPTFFEYKGNPIYISTDIAAIRIDKKKVNINYLIAELHSDYVIDQLNAYRTSSIITNLKKDDLFSIKIKLPSIQEQSKSYYIKAEKSLSTKSEQFTSDFNKEVLDVNDENSFLRHQIAGSLKNVRGAFKFIQRILKDKVNSELPGLYDLKASDELETTLANYLQIVDRDLNSINKSVNRFGDKIELMDLNFESFDLLKFIEEYVESLKIRSKNFYNVVLDLGEDAIKEDGFIGVHIDGDKDFLRKAFDNIIENAEKHAFDDGVNNRNQNKIKIELLFDFSDYSVQIDFSNTGKALPVEITLDSMVRRGSSSGNNPGDGIGLWFVNDVMKLHKGSFTFTDETGPDGIEDEYVTTMELTFPIIPAL